MTGWFHVLFPPASGVRTHFLPPGVCRQRIEDIRRRHGVAPLEVRRVGDVELDPGGWVMRAEPFEVVELGRGRAASWRTRHREIVRDVLDGLERVTVGDRPDFYRAALACAGHGMLYLRREDRDTLLEVLRGPVGATVVRDGCDSGLSS